MSTPPHCRWCQAWERDTCMHEGVRAAGWVGGSPRLALPEARPSRPCALGWQAHWGMPQLPTHLPCRCAAHCWPWPAVTYGTVQPVSAHQMRRRILGQCIRLHSAGQVGQTHGQAGKAGGSAAFWGGRKRLVAVQDVCISSQCRACVRACVCAYVRACAFLLQVAVGWGRAPSRAPARAPARALARAPARRRRGASVSPYPGPYHWQACSTSHGYPSGFTALLTQPPSIPNSVSIAALGFSARMST